MAVTFNKLPFSPPVASVSSTITIMGTGFTGATVVQINGVNATSYTVINDRLIEAQVPIANTGPISVTSPSGSATTSAQLQITPFNTEAQLSSASFMPNLQLTGLAGGNSNLLTWNISGTYDIYRGTSSGGETLLQAGVTTPYYFDNTAVNGTSYCYYIKQGLIVSNEICGIVPYNCSTCTIGPVKISFCCTDPGIHCCTVCDNGPCIPCPGWGTSAIFSCSGGQFTLRVNFTGEAAEHDQCVLYGTCDPVYLVGVFTALCNGGMGIVTSA